MTRPNKNTVDYFPHYCNHGKTIFILQRKFGNNGYAVWFKTLECLGKSDNHVLDLRNCDDWEFYVAEMGVSDAEINQILDLLAKLKAIDQELWENKVIWCNNFIKNIADVYKKRNNDLPKKPVLDSDNLVSVTENEVSDIDNPQSIVKESKVNKSNNIDLKLSEMLYEKILQNIPTFKKPNIERWANEVRKMREIDKRTPEQIEYLIDWSQNNNFWQANILSTAKLRKQFDTLVAQIKRDKINNNISEI